MSKKTGIRTYPPLAQGASLAGVKFEDWKPNHPIYTCSWRPPYQPRKKGSKVSLPYSDRWSFWTGSVFNWIDNAPYQLVYPNQDIEGQYFLRGGGKCCAGVEVSEQDLFVDGDWYYRIRKLTRKDRKIGEHEEHAWTFIIDSYPYDLPAIIRDSHKESLRRYMSEWIIGDFAITINHASTSKRKWLNKALTLKIQKALEPIFAKASDQCKLEF